MTESGTTTGTSGTGRLDDYVALAAARFGRMRSDTTSVSRAREVAKRFVPDAYKLNARLLATHVLEPRERRRAAAVGPSPMLHVGSGGEPKQGWVNIDLAGEPADLAWDLGRPLPFDDDSAAAVFHEHTLEHLPLAVGLALTRECFRVLQPGARLRIGVPDAGLLLESYSGDGDALEQLAPGRPSRLLAVQETFYEHQHVTMYDEHLLTLMFTEAGFVDVRRRESGDTDLPANGDTEARAPGTLYVEGAKPTR